jgi:hypothetical protein
MALLAHCITCDESTCPETVRGAGGVLAAWDMALVDGWRSTPELSHRDRRHFCPAHVSLLEFRPHEVRPASLLAVDAMADGATLDEGVRLALDIKRGARPILVTERGRSMQPWRVTGRTVRAALLFRAALAACNA